MLQRLFGQLPDFARPTHPMMRYVLSAAERRTNRRSQIIRLVAGLLFLAALIAVSLQIGTDFGRSPLDTANPLDNVFLVLFWPLVVIQLLVRLAAIGSTSGVISSEVQHGTWDTLKITTNGAVLAMKTRWAAVFYRLRMLLILIVLLRAVFIVFALINLTSFQGHYIDLLLSGTTPFGQPEISKDTSVIVGIVITAMMMTASLLAPFTSVAFDASVGMLVGTLSQGRLLGILGQVTLLIVRILLTVFALHLAASALSLTAPNVWPYELLATVPLIGWLAAFFGIAEGDMGLTLLYLPYVQRLWADRDYGALVGVAFLAYVLLQAALANALVKWAGHRAAKADAI
jgi:hypothetical protein